MESDPGRARRLHPLSPLLDGIRLLPSLAFALVLGAGGRWTVAGMLLALGVVGTVARYLSWTRFTYWVEGSELVVEIGITQRRRQVVPLGRIQQVDIQRKPQHRLFGLAVVRIDTAGSGEEAEVVLAAVGDDEAARLRSLLRSAPVGDGGEGASTGEVAAPGRDVVALRPGLLALGGITGARLMVMLAVAGSAAGFLFDVAPDTVERTVESAWGSRPPVLTALVVAVATLPLWFAAAAASAVLTDGAYRLVRRGDHLHLRRGLLDQRESTLPVHRVQAVRITQNPARRVLGLVTVTLQSAGGSHDGGGTESNVTIPVMRVSDLPRVMGDVLPVDAEVGPFRPAPRAARRRAWIRHLVPTAVLGTGLWVAALVVVGPSATTLGWAAAATLVAVGFAMASAEQSYAGLGWAASPVLVAARDGGWSRTTSLVPVAKAQSTRLTSSPFQRRVGLASLAIEVAGRGPTPTVVDGDAPALDGLRHRALGSALARSDETAVRRRAAEAAIDR